MGGNCRRGEVLSTVQKCFLEWIEILLISLVFTLIFVGQQGSVESRETEQIKVTI